MNKGNQNLKKIHEDKQRKPVKLRLKFFPPAMYRVYDDFGEEAITKNSDGTCEVEVAFPEDEWVYGYLLSFGCFVQVLKPAHIQKIISDRMTEALKFYKE